MSKKIVVAFLFILFVCVLTVISSLASIYVPYALQPEAPDVKDVQIASDFITNLFTGSVTYSYTFEVPKGTNNLQPSLQLSYNSLSIKQTPKAVGSGWSLTKNYISRDVENTPHNFSDDTYTLVLNDVSYQLVYDVSEDKYRTEIESYLDIRKSGGANNTLDQFWQVRTKDGTTYRFGFTDESELIANFNTSVVTMWSLDQVKDTHENAISYTYKEDPFTSDEGTVYLTEITYNKDNSRKIALRYETDNRPDMREVFIQAHKVRESKRLDEIEILFDGNTVRKYDITYTTVPEQKIQFIGSVVEYGSDNSTALTPTTFGYKPITSGWTENDYWESPPGVGCFANNNDRDKGIRFSDLNRDGKMDILVGLRNSTGHCEGNVRTAWINTDLGWLQDDQYEPPVCFVKNNGEDLGTRVVDVNGDGLDDILVGRQESNGSCSDSFRTAYINNGTGFELNDSWQPPVPETCFTKHQGQNRGVRLSDVNGDGFVDILYGARQGSGVCDDAERRAWINTGSGWIEDDSWELPDSSLCFVDPTEDRGVRLADLNGDGLPDIVKGRQTSSNQCDENERRAWINTGSGWVEDNAWRLPSSTLCLVKPGEDNGVRLIDMNADGLTDVIKSRQSAGGPCDTQAWMNNGTGWIQDVTWDIPEGSSCFVSNSGRNLGTRLVDVNGDGAIDVLRAQATGSGSCNSTQRRTWISNVQQVYLLHNVTNTLGGITTLEYTRSTSLNNYNEKSVGELGFNLWLLVNRTISDGLQRTAFYSYNYTGGKYDYFEDEFRGFNIVEEVRPDNATIIHYFHQDSPRKGKKYATEIYGSDDNLYLKTISEWDYTDQGTYYITNKQSESVFTYDGYASNPRITNTTYVYDEYGNTNETHNLGDVSLIGDEYYNITEFVVNESSWIVNAPKRKLVLAADGISQLRETNYTYDSASFGTLPNKGDVTTITGWVDSGENKITIIDYDSYGNAVNLTNSRGYKTQYIYGVTDTTYTYADKETNALGQSITYVYDVGTGNTLSETDSNGFVTSYEYDVHSRITKEIKPLDSTSFPTKEYIYAFDGVAPNNITIKSREVHGASGTLDQVQLFDGLGKLIESQSEGEYETIITEIQYDGLGRLKELSNPHFDGDAVYYIETQYDPLDRAVVMIYPDDTVYQTLYNRTHTSVIDQQNERKDNYIDAFGRIVNVIEYNNGETYNTSYSYNSVGELVSITNTFGDEISYEYDSVGRRIEQIDPNLGTWTYTYDAQDNLIRQEDEIGNVISLSYDALDRVLRKNSTDYVVDYTYDVSLNGTLSSLITENETFTYAYDEHLRQVEQNLTVDGVTFTTQVDRDALGRSVQQVQPDGFAINNSYNDQGFLESVDGFISATEYTPYGFVVNRTYANTVRSEFIFDPLRFRLTSISTGISQNVAYSYDNVSNIIGINDTSANLSYTMTYDDLHRLQSVEIPELYSANYTIDPLGRMLFIESSDAFLFTYGVTPLHAPSSVIEYTSGVLSLELLNVSIDGTDAVFSFTIVNLEEFNVSDISWSLDTGDGVINPSLDLNLTGGEDAFLFVYHNYTSAGSYNVSLNTSSGPYYDFASTEVTI